MERRPQELLDELHRAIAQTPDSAEQKALFEKLGVLERQLDALSRKQRELAAAEAQLAQAKSTVLVWRVVIGILLVALLGAVGGLIASLVELS
ncbi:MAG: hypothetical protein KJ634_01285 [Gammaproteobacteria bacterium]|nr:hypothetical protein [Gammaproteobacteria bacterium]MBU1414231.1 hypothetical protein [Gammaproteobacteria bacterium]